MCSNVSIETMCVEMSVLKPLCVEMVRSLSAYSGHLSTHRHASQLCMSMETYERIVTLLMCVPGGTSLQGAGHENPGPKLALAGKADSTSID